MFTAILVSCSNDDDQVDADVFEFVQPENFPPATYTFENNSITKEGFELGRKLFFDPSLSRDKSVSCANCHNQAVAFADPQHRLSVGVDGLVGARNAPPLTNMAFLNEFFWDGGVTHLDFVPLNALESDVEMDKDLNDLMDQLNNHPEYPQLFQEAFDIETITTPFVLQAFSQFTVMMVSANSRYDKYSRGDTDVLSADEVAGLTLFKEKCATCHAGELFTDQSYRNNGLDSEFNDRGRAIITELPEDEGRFRVPSLRNIELTDPYMHDGRFFTLEEVLDHYSEGVVPSETLDASLSGQTLGIPLTDSEKSLIISFLLTLTDTEFTSDPLFMIPR